MCKQALLSSYRLGCNTFDHRYEEQSLGVFEAPEEENAEPSALEMQNLEPRERVGK